MELKDLRTGNYVWDGYSGEMIIYSFSANDKTEFKEIFLKKSNELPSGLYYFKDIKPIPLTDQWLRNFGFEKRNKTEDGIIFGIKNFTLIYERTMDNDFAYFLNGYHNDCHLKYVHQLQNLYFALTGKELTEK